MKYPHQTPPHAYANENEVFSFQPLGLAADRLLVELSKKHEPDGERDRTESQEQQKKDTEREQYVAQRVKEIARFEQRYLTGRKGRR